MSTHCSHSAITCPLTTSLNFWTTPFRCRPNFKFAPCCISGGCTCRIMEASPQVVTWPCGSHFNGILYSTSVIFSITNKMGASRRIHPTCAQCRIFSIVRANFQKYDLYSAPIARALPGDIVPFFKFFKAGKCFKTMLFPVSCVSQKPLAFQKHSLLLIQPKTHAKTLSERSEKCATVQVLTDENSVARATYLQRALAALWRALYQV